MELFVFLLALAVAVAWGVKKASSEVRGIRDVYRQRVVARRQLVHDALAAGHSRRAVGLGDHLGAAVGATITGGGLAWRAFWRGFREGWPKGRERAYEIQSRYAGQRRCQHAVPVTGWMSRFHEHRMCGRPVGEGELWCAEHAPAEPQLTDQELGLPYVADPDSLLPDPAPQQGSAQPVMPPTPSGCEAMVGNPPRTCGAPPVSLSINGRRCERHNPSSETPAPSASASTPTTSGGSDMPIETATGGEVMTDDQLRLEMETIVAEASAELDDAQGEQERVEQDIARIELMGHSLAQREIDSAVRAKVTALLETVPMRKDNAAARIATAEMNASRARAVLEAMSTSEQGAYYGG